MKFVFFKLYVVVLALFFDKWPTGLLVEDRLCKQKQQHYGIIYYLWS